VTRRNTGVDRVVDQLIAVLERDRSQLIGWERTSQRSRCATGLISLVAAVPS
jgi:hypothetical protein